MMIGCIGYFWRHINQHYTMRVTAQSSSFSVHAIAGAHVVVLSINLVDNSPDPVDLQQEPLLDLLGFSFFREDQTENEAYFMRGYKSFRHNEIAVAPLAGGIPYG